jgi:3-oxoadipate enol-lactonase
MSSLDVTGSYLNSSDGPTVVFLHPLGADRQFWSPVAEMLDQFACYAVDLPGHGGSAVPDDGYDIIDLAEAVVAHVQAIHSEAVHLVGLSLGGIVATQIAAMQPGWVKSVVIADAVAVYPQPWPEQWRTRAATARRDGVAAMAPALMATWLTDDAIAADGPPAQYARSIFSSASSVGYAYACEMLATVDVREIVGAVAVPALVACGQFDGDIFRAGASWLAAQLYGGEPLWLEGVRHAGALERPVEFSNAIGAFIAAEVSA